MVCFERFRVSIKLLLPLICCKKCCERLQLPPVFAEARARSPWATIDCRLQAAAAAAEAFDLVSCRIERARALFLFAALYNVRRRCRRRRRRRRRRCRRSPIALVTSRDRISDHGGVGDTPSERASVSHRGTRRATSGGSGGGDDRELCFYERARGRARERRAARGSG